MATHAYMQVVAPLAVTPSTFLAALNTAVTFGTGALTGLAPNTEYVAMLDGTTGTCVALGTSDASGALAAVPVIPRLSRTFYNVGNLMPVLTVYTSRQCGYTLGAVARGTATIMVSILICADILLFQHSCKSLAPASSDG